MTGTQTPTRRTGRAAAVLGETGGLAGLLVSMALLFFALQPSVFLSPLNIQSIGFSLPEVGILALAMSVAMASGGIDLSIVAIANLATISMALVTKYLSGGGASDGAATAFAVLVALLVGTTCGLINGFLVAVVKIRPILATLATSQMFAGLGLAVTAGKALYTLPEPVLNLGVVTLAAVPMTVFLFLIGAVGIWLVMSRTGFGGSSQSRV